MAERFTCNENERVRIPMCPQFGSVKFFPYIGENSPYMFQKFIGKLANSTYEKIKNILYTYLAVVLFVGGSITLHQKLYFTYFQFMPVQIPASPAFTILTTIIETPFWEEFAFRVFPIQLVLILGRVLGKQFTDSMMPYIIILASIVFGWGHGGVQFIYAQGVAGIFLSRLYLKNNNSYWSVVIVHALWNILAVLAMYYTH